MERTQEENKKMNNIIALTSYKMMDLYEDYNLTDHMTHQVLQNIIKKSINAKEHLIEKLKKLEGWNECELRVKIGVKYSMRHDIFDIYNEFDWLCSNLPKGALPRDFNLYCKYDNLREYLNNANVKRLLLDTQYFKQSAIDELNSILNTNFSIKKSIVKIANDIVETWKKETLPHKELLKTINVALTELGEMTKGNATEENTVYISVNPFDFARMSEGNNWDSCHKPNGCVCSGPISYMLDKVSMVVYMESPSNNAKLSFRKMIHLSDNALICSRKYGFCDNEFLYALNAKLNELFLGADEYDIIRYEKFFKTAHNSTHYKDYDRFFDIAMTLYAKNDEEVEKKAIIGHSPLCLVCGEPHELEDELICLNCDCGTVCANCGERVNRNDAFEIDGDWYCNNCTDYCEECDEYFVNGEVDYYSSVHRWLCDDCAKKLLIQCENCGEWVSRDDCYITYDGKVFCEECAEKCLAYCQCCGDWYRVEDCHKLSNGDFYCNDCYKNLPVCDE